MIWPNLVWSAFRKKKSSNKKWANKHGLRNGKLFVELLESRELLSTATTVISSAPITTYGNNVSFTATVTSTVDSPVGTVTFLDGAATLGTVPISTVAGHQQASFTTLSPLALGSHTINAVYNPGGASVGVDPSSSGSTGETINYNPGDLVVSLVGTGTALTANGTATFLQDYTSAGA